LKKREKEDEVQTLFQTKKNNYLTALLKLLKY